MLRKILMGAATGVLLSGGLAAQEREVNVRTEPVSGNVHVLFGQGGNIGVSVGEDGVFIVDDQFAPLTPKIKEAIAKLSDGPIRFAINTHFHGDHTGGNENLGKENTVIVAHDNVRQRLSAGSFVKAFNMKTDPAPKAALPVVTFNNEMSLHLNGEDTRVIHVSGAHTDGDSIIHFKGSNVIHMGDLFFNELFPFIDVPNGGSIDGMIRGADTAIGLSDDATKIIPGHGPVTDKAGLTAYRNMLKETRDIVADMKAKGMTLEEIQAAKPIEAYKEKWRSFNEAWSDMYLGFIYSSLQ